MHHSNFKPALVLGFIGLFMVMVTVKMLYQDSDLHGQGIRVIADSYYVTEQQCMQTCSQDSTCVANILTEHQCVETRSGYQCMQYFSDC